MNLWSAALLVVVSLCLGAGAWLLFLWSVRSGQMDDVEAPKHRMLDDGVDDPPGDGSPPAAGGGGGTDGDSPGRGGDRREVSRRGGGGGAPGAPGSGTAWR